MFPAVMKPLPVSVSPSSGPCSSCRVCPYHYSIRITPSVYSVFSRMGRSINGCVEGDSFFILDRSEVKKTSSKLEISG